VYSRQHVGAKNGDAGLRFVFGSTAKSTLNSQATTYSVAHDVQGPQLPPGRIFDAAQSLGDCHRIERSIKRECLVRKLIYHHAVGSLRLRQGTDIDSHKCFTGAPGTSQVSGQKTHCEILSYSKIANFSLFAVRQPSSMKFGTGLHLSTLTHY